MKRGPGTEPWGTSNTWKESGGTRSSWNAHRCQGKGEFDGVLVNCLWRARPSGGGCGEECGCWWHKRDGADEKRMRSESRDAVSPGRHFHWRQDTLRRKQNKEGISETLWQERKGPSKIRG